MEKIIERIHIRMKENGWYLPLRMFLNSKEFEMIIGKLCIMTNNNEIWYPSMSRILSPFDNCKFNNVKGIIITGPYTCDKESITNFSNDKDLNKNFKKYYNIEKLEKEGILFIREFVTTLQVNSIKEVVHHRKLWKPFIDYIFDIVQKPSLGIFTKRICTINTKNIDKQIIDDFLTNIGIDLEKVKA